MKRYSVVLNHDMWGKSWATIEPDPSGLLVMYEDAARLEQQVEALRASREAWRQLGRVPQHEHELVRINLDLAYAADARAREVGALEEEK